jgi:glucosylglycerol-phosphate synthase
VDVLHSAGQYLDVLPQGISKGSTLRRLVTAIGMDAQDVLVAGDTLNDLSMFEEGFPGVVVGGAESRLTQAVGHLPTVRVATAPGAGGILGVLRDDGRLPEGNVPPEAPSGDAQLVMVYHRLPFEEQEREGVVVRGRPTSPNGIIPTLLGCFEGGRQGSWVAWTNTASGAGGVTHEEVDAERFPNLIAARLPLTRGDVERFYKRFSKEAFWPVIFSFVDRARFDAEDWAHFTEVNRRFAQAAATEADEGALVWVHDYNLWMVPGFLRELRPDVRIGFFHHTAFPPADVFNVIPWAGQIIASLAQCDHVGFHVPRYGANFLDTLRSHMPVTVLETEDCAPRFKVHGVALAVPSMPTRIRAGDRTLTLGAHPVGVNLGAVRAVLRQPTRQAEVGALRHERRGVRVILSVERLDYVKGPLQKLEAFERLLEGRPEHRGTVQLLFITTPPAPGMGVYDEIRDAVDQAVGRINGKFGSLDWTPVRYLFRSLPFEEVLVQAAAADVAWITPLRDGLNLVAKEYVAAHGLTDGDGVLLLSEFAGAAVEMHGALLSNPYDVAGMADDLHHALSLGPDERRQRLRRMMTGLEHHDVEAWSRGFLDRLKG